MVKEFVLSLGRYDKKHWGSVRYRGVKKKRMLVCGNGKVSEFCKNHDMLICESYDGDPESYSGTCHVLVTDRDMSENEYYFLKGKLLARGVELVSTRYKDDELISGFLAYQVAPRKKNYVGRQMFGYCVKNGEAGPVPGSLAVVRRILELRDEGYTLRKIREDAGVHHLDGRCLSVSTIQQIIKNREK